MSEKTAFVKLDVSHTSVYLLTQCFDNGRDGFHLTLIDGENTWRGKLSGDDLDDMSTKIKMDFNSYVDQTMKALTQENSADMTFAYDLKKPSGPVVEFAWKKMVTSEDIKFQLGSVKLTKDNKSTAIIMNSFEHCIGCITELKSTIRSLTTDNQRLSQERTNALKRLDKCVTAKEELEKDLYSKFVDVLNTKKQKIRELKDEARLLQEKGANSCGDSSNIPSTSKPAQVKEEPQSVAETLIKQESESEENTDDEKPASKRRKKATPATKSNDDSLMLDDGLDEPITTVSRPQRQRGGNKKQTPSKPVLPKVPSGGSSSSNDSKKTSIRKSTSRGSKSTAVDHENPEDLFDDL